VIFGFDISEIGGWLLTTSEKEKAAVQQLFFLNVKASL
jgi:hypothetical protein